MTANEDKSHRTQDKRPRSAVTSARTLACPAALRASSVAACVGVQPDPTLSLVAPSNRATVRYFHRFQCGGTKIPRQDHGFGRRLRMSWELQFAIADLAGGDWPK
jgi:hypothetical protein